jgi:hypothetical protein
MSQFLQQLTDNFVVLAAALILLGLGWFSISYLSKRRQMLHQERMASLVRGLHYAGVAKDILSQPSKPKAGSRDHALSGLRWLFGAAGVSATLYASAAMQPFADPTIVHRAALPGIIPGLIGLIHLIISAILRKRELRDFFPIVSQNRPRYWVPTRVPTRTSYR